MKSLDTQRTFVQFADDIPAKTKATLLKYSQITLDRLAHLEFVLMFQGKASRSDLIYRFGTASAQATKDFALYRTVAPENMIYDPKMRENYRGDKFKPLFSFDVERILASLTLGFGDGFGRKLSTFNDAVEGSTLLVKPSIKILATICEAIYLNAPLKIKYFSTSSTSEDKWRVIVPHTVVNSTLKWHVRAYDRKTSEFRDFILTRISEAEVLSPKEYREIVPTSRETEKFDHDWKRMVTLELMPHPTLKNNEFVCLDYAIDPEKGYREVVQRAAIAPYFLRAWNIDCSKNPTKNSENKYYHLALRNVEILNSIMNSHLAPGAEELEIHNQTTIKTERPANFKTIHNACKKQRRAILNALEEKASEEVKRIADKIELFNEESKKYIN